MDRPFENPALQVPWDRSVTDLADCGWSLVESAVGFGQIERLAAKDGSRWVLLEDEGVARQHGFGTYMPFDSAQPAVRQLGIDLVLGLSRAAERRQLPAVPEFNEVSWTRYPAHQGMITRHRDFREYGGIIAVITLQGSSVFRVYDSPIDAVEWHTKPGQLVLLRGEGWPSAGKRCPPHEVDPPSDGERSIITLRCNSQGAGAGYKV